MRKFGLLFLFVVGCSSTTPMPNLTQVRGKVLYADGSPIREGKVMFTAIGTGVDGHADLSPDGTFVLKTLSGNEGAVAGKYRVSIDPQSKEAQRKIPMKYRDGDSTKLITVIPTTDTNDLVIRVPSK